MSHTHTAWVGEEPHPHSLGQGRPTQSVRTNIPTPPQMVGDITRTIPDLVLQIMYITKWFNVRLVVFTVDNSPQTSNSSIFIKVYNAY